MLTKLNSYKAVVNEFNWHVPQDYNIAWDICDKWVAESRRIALMDETDDGVVRYFSFKDIYLFSNQLANVLSALGLERGDRVGILMPQRLEVAVTHLATYRSGAIAVPLFTLFGQDALQYRLKDSGARIVVTDTLGAATLASIRDELPELRVVLNVDGAGDGTMDYQALLGRASDSFETVKTSSNDPALIIYTSGTTGDPKGALLPHRTMIGHMPGVEFSHDFLGQKGDLIWSPADWAWIGGLIDVLFAAWQLGVPVIAKRFEKFDPDLALDLMLKHSVRNVFMPPTALRMLKTIPTTTFNKLKLRSLASGGESLGSELQEWSKNTLGILINEFYGQTECNMTVSGCSALYELRAGSIGRAAPGHTIAIIDECGNEKQYGESGMIAVATPNPVMFLEYWNNKKATQEKFVGKWLITGDTGSMDDEGYVTFVGRDDDVITSAGYRIGPGPIEDCLTSHPSVTLAAVIGKPDRDRTEIVKAYVVLREGLDENEKLSDELKAWVRHRLAKHEYPREIEFVSDLPKTNTGKIIRRILRT
jgi:acetyl-CoA synthetase